MRFMMLATYFVVILITLVLMCSYVIGLLRDDLYNSETVDMFAKANIISATVSEVWNDTPENERIADYVERILAGTNIRGVVENSSYAVLYDTNHESRLFGKVYMRDAIKLALDGEQAQRIDDGENGTKLISVAVPITKNGNIVGSVYLAQSAGIIESAVKSTSTSLIIFSVLIIILIGMLSLGMSYIITSPVAEFIEAAHEISKGNFTKRINVKGHNEIAQMGETLNYMCDELSLLEEKRRKFVSDASHELKTPMAGIKLICDSLVSAENPDSEMVKEFLNDLSEEVDRLTRIIERLLALTKLDAGAASLKLEEIDIRLLADHVVRKLKPIAEPRGITVITDYNNIDFSPILIDYDKIYEAIYNIADNAIKYSPDNSDVKIGIFENTDSIIIEISDKGQGIPENERDRIFERFYRLDDSRARDTGGTGLGLAITKEAVQMHGGTITVEEAENGGSIFIIKLPYSRMM